MLLKHNVDAFLVSSLVNLRYLFGFTGSNAQSLITPDHCFFFTDRRYTQQAREQVTTAKIVIAKHDLLSELKNLDLMSKKLRMGIEAMHLTVKEFTHLKKTLPGIKIVALERFVEKIASVKDAEEIENVRRAGAICGKVFDEIKPLLKPGVGELDISAEISYRAKRHGSERDPFEPIVASGVRSALPHGISSRKSLASGELVIIDFGAVVEGYAADFTRTVLLGQLTEQQKTWAGWVQQALEKAEQAAKPGMEGRELDAVARDFFRQHQCDEFFQHSLGHGLGLDVHELPRIGERSQDKLVVGNVITLEPGLYSENVGGIRIEDDFVVTETGLENLTPFPREVVRVG